MAANHRATAKLFVSEIARASGLTFARDDRLSRQEADAVIRWAERNPEVMAAYADRAHAGHAEVMAYAQMAFMFKHEYPENEAGEPIDWDEVEVAGGPAAETAAEPAWDDPFKDFSPEQALARIEAAMKDPKYQEFRNARDDRMHPDHALAQREWTALFERAYPEQRADPSPGVSPATGGAPSGSGTPAAGSAPGAPMDQAAARSAIDALYRDPEFIGRSSSLDREIRAAATAEAGALFAVAYPEPASGTGEGAAPAGGDEPA
jgi:hypothetical protein